jgi:predicted acyl esterase
VEKLNHVSKQTITKRKESDGKMRKVIVSVLASLFIIGLLVGPAPAVSADSGAVFFDTYVAMRDGVQLYTRVYLPDPGIWGPGPYPVILCRTPYGIGTPGSPPTTWPVDVQLGYARVDQDTRGRYFSQGLDRLFYDDTSDGYDTVDWIANQTWCDGNIGAYGYSAPGITAFLAGAEYNPHLKAIAPLSSSGNLMNDLTFEGGAFRGDALLWGIGQTVSGLSTIPGGHRDLLGIDPVTWMSDTMMVYSLLLNLMGYAGNPTAPGSYWMHLPWYNFNPSYVTMQPYANEILSHPDEDAWRDHYRVYDTVEVPTLLATGWYDFFQRPQIDAFVALQARGVPVKLVVGPGTHGTPPPIPVYEWFDYWLKGIDNGIMDEPPVHYYCMEANEWRWANQWPPEEVEYVDYYLHEGGVLSTDSSTGWEEPDSYTYDPMNPVITRGGANLMLSSGPLDQTPVVLGRDDILTYTGSPLTEDVEAAGPLTVVLSVSSNRTDTDFTAKLIDVYPTGDLMLVADGIIRARYRDSMAVPELMEPGEVYTITFDIGNIGHLFEAGHSIRVDISSSNFPKYDRNLNTGGVLYKESTWTVAENTVYHDADNPSYIKLPVVPKWEVTGLLPTAKDSKAGRTVPVKFSLTVAESSDPNQPFVYDEDLEIVIYAKDNPGDILQTSTFGDTSRDYRIDAKKELYITNFVTLGTPKTYVVEVYRYRAAGLLIGSFEFSTVK